jgi:hypothetical protein
MPILYDPKIGVEFPVFVFFIIALNLIDFIGLGISGLL